MLSTSEILQKENANRISLTDPHLSAFIEQHTTEPLYYDQAWLSLLEKLYGYSIIPLTTTNSNGEITGFLPLCSINSLLTGKRLVGLPFSDYCPLLAVDNDSANDLLDQAMHLAQKQKVKYLELRTGGNDVLAQHHDFVEGNLYVRWLLPLTTNPDDIESRLRKPILRQIKKSQNFGVKVRIAESREDVPLYYRLHLQTRSKKHGMPAQPQKFFYHLWDALSTKGNIKLLLAEHEGKVIAGMILLATGSTVRYAYGASDEKYLHLAPNNLIMWTAITWGCLQGYQTFDLGRTACDNEGLMEFKRRWGAIKEPLLYYYYPHMAGLAATSESSWKSRLLTASWKQLPLQITEPIGSYLYKHLG
jgi:Acetyltransferase (GNAT) domain